MVSIIICTLGSNSIHNALKSLISQVKETDEIIIVKPNDLPFEYDHNKVRIVSSKKGLAIQRNTGLKNRFNDIVWFLDDDVLVDDGAVEELKKHYTENILSLGCEFGVKNNVKSNFKHRIFAKFFMLTDNNGDGSIKLSAMPSFSKNTKNIKRIYCLRGFMMSFHFGRIQSEEYFDYFFDKYWWGDDFEFSMRIGKKGHLYKIPKTMIYHEGNASVNLTSEAIKKIIFNLKYIQNKYNISHIFRFWSKLGLRTFKNYLVCKKY